MYLKSLSNKYAFVIFVVVFSALSLQNTLKVSFMLTKVQNNLYTFAIPGAYEDLTSFGRYVFQSEAGGHITTTTKACPHQVLKAADVPV